MRLLIDELFPPSIAVQLRARGHDATAVQEEAELRGLPDTELFAEAQRRERAILTENVADFLLLDAEYRARQRAHWGLVFTTNRNFPRGRPGTIGALVRALDILFDDEPTSEPSSRVVWLQRGD